MTTIVLMFLNLLKLCLWHVLVTKFYDSSIVCHSVALFLPQSTPLLRGNIWSIKMMETLFTPRLYFEATLFQGLIVKKIIFTFLEYLMVSDNIYQSLATKRFRLWRKIIDRSILKFITLNRYWELICFSFLKKVGTKWILTQIAKQNFINSKKLNIMTQLSLLD